MRCICPPDSVPMARLSKPVRPTARDGVADFLLRILADAAEESGLPPQPHRHHVVDIDREGAIDLGGLRQIRDLMRIDAGAGNFARQRLERADHALEQGRLAGAVRADHGDQRAVFDLAAEMMHGRMAVIAEREIAELQLRVHAASAPRTRPPRAARSARRTTKRRSTTDSRRIDGAMEAGGCECPAW